jgi:hypothetical protein
MTRNPFAKLQKVSEKSNKDRTTEDINKNFKDIFFALSAQTGCPTRATQKYYKIVIAGLHNEGAGYLKVLAAQPIFGLRVLGNDLPIASDYGLKVRSRTTFPILFAWHYQRLRQLSKLEPTSSNVLLVRRILSFLSIGKMLKLGGAKRINKERLLYAERVNRKVSPDRVETIREEQTSDIMSFLKSTRFTSERVDIGTPGANPIVGKVFLDPSCYSLKSLVKPQNKKFKQLIPIPVLRYLMRVEEGQFNYACDPSVPDGKQVILVEKGGKFRGITPYSSPLVHSSSVYRNMRRILNGWEPDVSLDQEIGHERCRVLTTLGRTVVSADASNFTDSIDLDLATVFLDLAGEGEFLDYLSELKISTAKGIISTPLPLMGLKGCYELGCCLLAYAVWLQARKRTLSLKTMAHACDDLVGTGSFEGFRDSYEFIGSSLNTKKTIVSKTTAIFCGQMYWRGEKVTPIRFNITSMSEDRDGTIVLPQARSFIDNCYPVWGRSARKTAFAIIRRAAIRCVGIYNLNFSLPTKLGGLPIERTSCVGLLSLLSDERVLKYALFNTPIIEEPPDRTSAMIAYVRLGEPARMPDGTVLPAITMPTVVNRKYYISRKLEIAKAIASGTLSDLDVLTYYYS